jgi:hypothetical protein
MRGALQKAQAALRFGPIEERLNVIGVAPHSCAAHVYALFVVTMPEACDYPVCPFVPLPKLDQKAFGHFKRGV